MSDEARATPEAPAQGATMTALKVWAQAYRVELVLFALSFFTLTMFSGQRFLRQSAAPHFVYQAKAWLDGRQDIDPEVLPNLEDWACVREVNCPSASHKPSSFRSTVNEKWLLLMLTASGLITQVSQPGTGTRMRTS